MCMYEGSDPATLLHSRAQKARKEHKCSECHRSIMPGEKYLAERFVFEGSASSLKVCRHCQVVRDWLTKECGGYVYEGLAEDIHEHAQESYGIGVKMLAVGIWKKWQRKDGKLWPIPSCPKTTHELMKNAVHH